MTLHQNDAILTPSDETTTVTSMNFLTFEDNYLAGQSPERKIIMTNKEKALALIGTFVSGDTAKAKELLAPGYIQHNLAFGTGAGEQVGFDVFRFDEDGKIAEHWDVMETLADKSTWANENGKF